MWAFSNKFTSCLQINLSNNLGHSKKMSGSAARRNLKSVLEKYYFFEKKWYFFSNLQSKM